MFSFPAIMSSLLSIFFIFSKTPLVMALVIIVQAMAIAFCTFTIFSTSWFSFILFMIFISAMMIIFVYVSSLASNDFFSFEAPSFSFILPSAGAMVMLFYMNNSVPNSPQYSQLNMSDMKLGAVSAYKLYSTYVVLMVIFLIVYLLIALIVVAKNSSSSKGALRALKS